MIKWSTKLQNTALEALRTAFNDGTIYIYSGTQPVSSDAAVQGTLLGKVTVNAGTFVFGAPTNGLAFDAAAAGVLSKAVAEVWQFTGLATGTPGWFRFMGNPTDNLGSDATFLLNRMDGRIATSGAEMNINPLSVVLGAVSTVDSFTISMPTSIK